MKRKTAVELFKLVGMTSLQIEKIARSDLDDEIRDNLVIDIVRLTMEHKADDRKRCISSFKRQVEQLEKGIG